MEEEQGTVVRSSQPHPRPFVIIPPAGPSTVEIKSRPGSSSSRTTFSETYPGGSSSKQRKRISHQAPPVTIIRSIDHYTVRQLAGRLPREDNRKPGKKTTFGNVARFLGLGSNDPLFVDQPVSRAGAYVTTQDRETQYSPCCVEVLCHERIVDASCGYFHSVVVNDRGVVYTSGLDMSGQRGWGQTATDSVPKVVSELRGIRITNVTAGAHHSIAVSDSGEVWVFGKNEDGQLGLVPRHGEQQTPCRLQFPNSERIVQAAAGEKHSIFLTNEGIVYGVGNNYFGQVGVEEGQSHTLEHQLRQVPLPVRKDGRTRPVVFVACGACHTVLVTDIGEVYSFGQGIHGQLGIGRTAKHLRTPTLVPGLSKHRIIQAACGSAHTAVLAASGDVFTFGEGSYGALGLGTEASQLLPRRITALPVPAVRIACGLYHTMLISAERQVWVFGRNDHGQLGCGDTRFRYTPEMLPYFSEKRLISIASHGTHSLAISDTGVLYSWGNNAHGQLGLVTSQIVPLVPPPFIPGERFSTISCGVNFTVGVTLDGHVYSWGKNEFGKLGLGHTRDRYEPQPVTSLEGVHISSVSAGLHHAIALSDNGRVYGWGCGLYGQHGLGRCVDCLVPEPLTGGGLDTRRVIHIASGFAHAAAVTAEGQVWVWGRIDAGHARSTPAHVVSGPPRARSVACGASSIAILIADEEVYTWSSRTAFKDEELRVRGGPGGGGEGRAPPSSVVDVPASPSPAAAMSNVPSSSSPSSSEAVTRRYIFKPVQELMQKRIVSIECGPQFFLALTDKGEVYTWGSSTTGQLGHGDHVAVAEIPRLVQGLQGKHIVQASTSAYITALLTDKGSMYVFGSGLLGGLGLGHNENQLFPQHVELLAQVVIRSVACGHAHTFAISESGQAYMWGCATEGALGIGEQNKNEPVPRRLPLSEFTLCDEYGQPLEYLRDTTKSLMNTQQSRQMLPSDRPPSLPANVQTYSRNADEYQHDSLQNRSSWAHSDYAA